MSTKAQLEAQVQDLTIKLKTQIATTNRLRAMLSVAKVQGEAQAVTRAAFQRSPEQEAARAKAMASGQSVRV